VGAIVGDRDGDIDGFPLGICDGDLLGAIEMLGLIDGEALGAFVGCIVGERDGNPEGNVEGCNVG